MKTLEELQQIADQATAEEQRTFALYQAAIEAYNRAPVGQRADLAAIKQAAYYVWDDAGDAMFDARDAYCYAKNTQPAPAVLTHDTGRLVLTGAQAAIIMQARGYTHVNTLAGPVRIADWTPYSLQPSAYQVTFRAENELTDAEQAPNGLYNGIWTFVTC